MNHRHLLLALAAFAAAGSSFAAEAATYRVDVSTGTDTAGCGSVVSPCASIQQAVNLAVSGDLVLVAGGTYTYQAAIDPCATDTGVVCIVNKQLTVLGGFTSGNWTTPDPVANPTIVDGETLRRAVLVTRTFPGAPVASLRLEGFILRDGRAFGTVAVPNGQGGCLKAALSSVVLRDLVVEDCAAIGADVAADVGGFGVGGGIYVSSSVDLIVSVTLERVRLEGNTAEGGDGASRGGFGEGGGMFANRSILAVSELTVLDNSALAGNSTGAGVSGGQRADALGGGIAVLADSSGTFRDVTAEGNLAQGGGSAEQAGGAFGGGFYVERSDLSLIDVDLRHNQSIAGDGGVRGGLGAGGGLMSFDADLVIDRIHLIDNLAQGGDGPTTKGSAGGGGAYFERATEPSVEVTMANSVVASNMVTLGSGGGVVGGGGAGLFVLGIDVEADHVTLVDNRLSTSPLVGQAAVTAPRLGSPARLDLDYSIVADHASLSNVAALQAQSGTTLDLNRVLFAGNELDTNQGVGSPGTISGLATTLAAADPGLESPGMPDFDYHLATGSAAIDEATTSTAALDFDQTYRGAPRDLGADEWCSATQNDVFIAAETLTGARLEEACETISVATYQVSTGGELTLRAGRRVVFGSGFRVGSEGTLSTATVVP